MPLKILALQFHLFLITQVRCFILYEASVSLLHLLSIFIIPSVRDQSSFLPRHPNSRLLFHREMSETTHPRPQVFSVSGSIIWQFCCMIDVISSILHNSPKFGQQ